MRTRWRRGVETLSVVLRYFADRGVEAAEAAVGHWLMAASVRRGRILARRERERPHEKNHWFTRDEAVLVAAVTSLILPSEEQAPGAKEADVVVALDRLVARTPSRQEIYARGLLAFDEWSARQHHQRFADLSPGQQLVLLTRAEQVYAGVTTSPLLTARIARKLRIIYWKWRCPVVELLPHLSQDVCTVFYTNPVSWKWLGYDGPPMPRGYPDLLEREWQHSESDRERPERGLA
jgi:Gluconate 2-dehydrogenase subunit 3